MKKALLILVLILITGLVNAQAPEKMSYQAVARDLSGLPLVSTAVNLQFDILQGSSTGVVTYSETQSKTTNQFGLFTAEIGAGTVVSGSFPAIAWGVNAYYLRITVNGDAMPATQLLSVPYALYSKTSGGAGAGLVPGAGINITGGVITSTLDTSVTNEFQTLTTNATLDTVFLSNNGGFVYIPAIAGDDWGLDTVNTLGNNILGSGTVANPLVVIDNDTSLTNEIQVLSISNDTIFLSNGGFVQLPTALGDNWGVDTVNTLGANITGSGTVANPLVVIDNDTSLTNEIQVLSISNDTIFLSNGGFAQLPPAASDTDWTTAAGVVYNLNENVGIGTTTPGAKLAIQTVIGDNATLTTQVVNQNNGAANFRGIYGLAQSSGAASEYIGGSFQGFGSGVGTAIGVRGTASGGITNWAGYFENGDVYVENDLGVGTLNPNHKLSVVSSDSIVASFRANNPNFGAILINNLNPTAPRGIILLSGTDTAILGLDPVQKMLALDNSVVGGHIAINADSSIVSSAEVIGNTATSKILNRTDTIYSISNSGTNIINVNQGTFYTDSLYVLGNNINNGGYVLTNDGFGQAEWQPASAGLNGIYSGSDTLSGNTTVTQLANILAFTSTAVNGFNVDGSTFSVDALNNRVGIGTAAPTASLSVENTTSGTAVEALSSGTAGFANFGGTFTASGASSIVRGLQGVAQGSTGNQVGVYAVAQGSGVSSSYGMYALNSSTNTNSTFAGFFDNTNTTGSFIYGIRSNVNGAASASTRYGIYTNVQNGTTNWAAYFNNGNVNIKDTLFLQNGAAAGLVLTSIDGTGKTVWQAPSGGITIADADGDTEINVEASADQDVIHFSMGNNSGYAAVEYFTMIGPRLEVINSGRSVFMGEGAGANTDITTNRSAVAIGYNALNSNVLGNFGVAIGAFSQQNATASNNVSVGRFTLSSITAATNLTAIGSDALRFNTSGSENTAVGTGASGSNITGTNNTSVGYVAGGSTDVGAFNTSIGASSLFFNTLGNFNTAIGYQSLYNSTGNNNVGLGRISGLNNVSGVDNTFLGSGADATVNNLTNATAIGANSIVSQNNSLILGNNANVGIGTSNPSQKLDVIGITKTDSLIVTTNAGTSGDVLTNDGTGNAIWQTSASGSSVSIIDADGDTEINVEASIDQDVIHFSLGDNAGYAGAEYFTMIGPRLEVINSGGSVFLGQNAGLNNDLNNRFSVAIGSEALRNTTIGNFNTAVGYQAMTSVFVNNNSAFGYFALRNSGGSNNTAMGYQAIVSGGGSQNTGVGGLSLSNTQGDNNTAIGYQAGDINGLGSDNTFLGSGADATVNNLTNATAIGANSIVSQNNSLILGNNANVGIGTSNPSQKLDVIGITKTDSLIVTTNAGTSGDVLTNDGTGNAIWQTSASGSSVSIIDADGDTEINVEASIDQDVIHFSLGDNAGYAGAEYFTMIGPRLEVINSGNSVFLGQQAGAADDLSNNNNAFVGFQSGLSNTTGSSNTVVGTAAFRLNITGSQNTALGYQSLTNNSTGFNNTVTGVQAGLFNTTGSSNTATGVEAMYSNAIGNLNAAFGYLALSSNVAGSRAVAIGAFALRNSNDNVTAFNNYNVGVGYEALRGGFTPSLNTGNNNTALGAQSLLDNTSGNENVAIGRSLQANTSGSRNIAIGQFALNSSTTASNNTAVGFDAMNGNTSGIQNVAVGYQALQLNQLGNSNSAFGFQALQNTMGQNNTGLGLYAGNINTTGTNNTFIGHAANAAAGQTNLNNATAIGSGAIVNTSNSLILGNNANVGIGTSSPGAKLHLDGTLRLENLGGSAPAGGEVLTYNPVTFNAEWQTPAAGSNGIYTGSGTLSGGNTTITMGTDNIAFVSTATAANSFSVDGNTFSVDALNNRVGFGAAAPQATVHIANNTDLHSMEVYNSTNSASNTHLISGNNSGTGTGIKFGIQLTTNGTGGNNNYGGWLTASGANISNTAINASSTASGTSQATGIFATAAGSGTGTTYAVYGQNSAATSGVAYAGRFRSLNSNAVIVYGVRSEVSSTSPNDQYAFRGDITSAPSAGTRYGIYTSATGGTTNWAAYFASGDVYVADNVGIGTNTPAAKLDVIGKVKITDGTEGAGHVLTSDAAGLASWKQAVNFSVNSSTTSIPAGITTALIFDNVEYDNTGDFNVATGQFVSPETGVYHIDAVVTFDVSSAHEIQIQILRNGGTHKTVTIYTDPTENTATAHISADIYLPVVNNVSIGIYQNSGGNINSTGTLGTSRVYFTGHLVR